MGVSHQQLFVFACVWAFTDSTYERQFLTQVPTDISTTETTLSLSRNRIATIDSFPNITQLMSLKINMNLLVEFPNLLSVADTLLELYLRNNRIAVIDPNRLDGLPNLIRLSLMGNSLTAIPDVPGPGLTLSHLWLNKNQFTSPPKLEHLGRSLEHLYIRTNPISGWHWRDKLNSTKLFKLQLSNTRIGKIPVLRKEVKRVIRQLMLRNTGLTSIETRELQGFDNLEFLSVGHNDFREFPDLSHVGDSLTIFYMNDNRSPLKSLSNSFKTQTVLTKVNFDGTPWKVLPNMCHAQFVGGPVISMRTSANGSWLCDCHSRWMKMMEGRGASVNYKPGLVCDGPTHNQGKAWQSLTIEDLTCTGYSQASYVNPIDTDTFYCASAPVSETHDVISPVECAALCMERPFCLYYNLQDDFDNFVCSLTDITYANISKVPSFPDYGTWYALD